MSVERRLPSRRDALRITAAVGLTLSMGGSVVRRARLHRVRETRPALGTLVTLTLIHPDPDQARIVLAGAFAGIDALEDALSRHRPTSALARLNRSGVLTDPPHALVCVLETARRWSAETNGAFDPTVLPLLRLHERCYAAGRAPTDGEVADACARVDHRALEITPERVALLRPGMAVTLDGIAKGYVVDRTVARLVEAGAERVLVDAGGDMAGGGARLRAEPWQVAVADASGRATVDRIALREGAVATSGDYLQAFTGDRSAHHILDPRTGRSPTTVSSASVIAPTAQDADALSTAVLVLGPVEGVALLARLTAVEGLLVTKGGEVLRTAGFGRRVGESG